MDNKAIISDSEKLNKLFLNKYNKLQVKTFAEIVADYLKTKNIKLSVAESLTGGMVASRLVDIAGISDYFYEGIVAYSNGAKINRLNVSSETLNKYGAVSVQTAAEMAKGLIGKADIAISTTGIAGPSGGTSATPVGFVCFGLATKNDLYCVEQKFTGNRAEIREKATNFALSYLIMYLSGEI